MGEKTINFKHSPFVGKSITNLDNLKGFAVFVLDFVNLKKILKNDRANELYQLVNELEFGKLVDQEFKNKVCEAIWCDYCKNLKNSCFECGCRICEHYFAAFRKKLEVAMNSQDLEKYLNKVKKMKCPECEEKISENDLKILNPNHDEFIENCRKSTITLRIQENQKFSCYTCKKERGPYLCPSLEIHPCLHMCKICISKGYYKNKSKICAQCSCAIKLDILVREKHPCATCNKEFHVVGDRMIEIDPGFLLCPTCGIKLLELGYSERTDRTLSLKEKVENYSYLYPECSKCKKDEFFRRSSSKKCCYQYFCNKCSINQSSCPNCVR